MSSDDDIKSYLGNIHLSLGFNSNKYSDGMLIENLVEDKNVFKGYSLNVL